MEGSGFRVQGSGFRVQNTACCDVDRHSAVHRRKILHHRKGPTFRPLVRESEAGKITVTNKKHLGKFMATISYDPSGVFLEQGGIRPGELAEIGPRLAAARDEVLADARLWATGGDIRATNSRWTPVFTSCRNGCWPTCAKKARNSEVARLRAVADRLAGTCRHRGGARNRRLVHGGAGTFGGLLSPIL